MWTTGFSQFAVKVHSIDNRVRQTHQLSWTLTHVLTRPIKDLANHNWLWRIQNAWANEEEYVIINTQSEHLFRFNTNLLHEFCMSLNQNTGESGFVPTTLWQEFVLVYWAYSYAILAAMTLKHRTETAQNVARKKMHTASEYNLGHCQGVKCTNPLL